MAMRSFADNTDRNWTIFPIYRQSMRSISQCCLAWNDGTTYNADSVGDLLKFFLLTFAVTWTCFISVAVAIPAEKPLGYVLVLMGAYAPSFVALALTAWRERQQGVRAILRHVVQWQVAKRWRSEEHTSELQSPQ